MPRHDTSFDNGPLIRYRPCHSRWHIAQPTAAAGRGHGPGPARASAGYFRSRPARAPVAQVGPMPTGRV